MEDFEIANAREWDQDTDVSGSVVGGPTVGQQQATPLAPARYNATAIGSTPRNNFSNGLPRATSVPNVPDTQRNPQTTPFRIQAQQPGQRTLNARGTTARSGYRNAPRGSTLRGGAPRASIGHQGHDRSSSASVEIITSRDQAQGYGRGGGFRSNSQKTYRRSPSRPSLYSSEMKNFAKAAGLVTTRRAADYEEKATKKAYNQTYLQPPSASENYPVVGYYMWPTQDRSPSDLLGARLNALDPVRLDFHVHIEDVPKEECLRISCPAFHREPERWLARAIEGVRAAIKDSLAQEIAARPLYIVVPPDAEAMRSLVIAADLQEILLPRPEPLPPMKTWRALDIGFAGDNISEEEILKWKYSGSKDFAGSNLLKIEDRLRSGLVSLSSSKRSMRMRVHFGRTVLTKMLPKFRNGEMDFKTFVNMMDQGLESDFVKDMRDPSAAMQLRGLIIQSTEHFRSVGAFYADLGDVRFKDVAVILVESNDGQQFRIEADLDRNAEGIEDEIPLYQVGFVKHFKHDRTNLRMQVEVIDFEKKIDYSLNVVSDDQIREVNKNLNNITRDLLGKGRSRIQEDILGLHFPRISPRGAAGLRIISVVVQSTVQYMLKNSNYIVEIAIDRKWRTTNTKPPPMISARVSMYSPAWDDQMVSFEDNPNERDWRPDLSDFFDKPKDDSSRVANFVSDVEYVKDLLAEARQLARNSIDDPAPVDDLSPVNNLIPISGLASETEVDLYSADG